jgi:hypothetical protein
MSGFLPSTALEMPYSYPFPGMPKAGCRDFPDGTVPITCSDELAPAQRTKATGLKNNPLAALQKVKKY